MAALMLVNPRKRRKSKKRAKSRTRTIVKYRTKKPKRRIRRRKNPIRARGMVGKVIKATQNGAIGSLGAIAGTIVGNVLPLPETLKVGNMGMVIEALVGIGTGVLVGNFMNKGIGEQMAQGAVTVALHGTMKNIIGQAVPTLNLSGYDDGLFGYDDGLLGMGAYDGDDFGMGAYSGAGYTGMSESELNDQ